MAGGIDAALVSLWSSATSTAEKYFLASGVLVAPGVVLTAAHVFDNRAFNKVWVRCLGQSAAPVLRAPKCHPELDAALCEIEAISHLAQPVELDRRMKLPRGQVFTLNGYFEGRLDTGAPRTVMPFDPGSRWYPVEPGQGKGLSGAALCLGASLWGITIRRYKDAAANRGCVVAVHQLWEGFLDQVVDSSKTVLPPVLPPAEDPLRPHALNAVKRLFIRPPLQDWNWAAPIVDGLPNRCREAFDGAASSCGERLLKLLADDLLPSLHKAVEQGDLSVDAAAARRLRPLLLEAIGLAARLCLEPAQRRQLEAAVGKVEVPAQHTASAALGLRARPLEALVPVPGSASRTSTDQFSVAHGLETGPGNDQRLGLASVVASLRSERNPTAQAVVIRNQDELRQWRSFLLEERDQGRGRHLMLGQQDTQALGPELVAFLNGLGVRVVALTGQDTGLFWFEEDRLVGKINRVLADLHQHPLWKDTHGAA